VGALVRARGARTLAREHLPPAPPPDPSGDAGALSLPRPIAAAAVAATSAPTTQSYDDMERAYIRTVLELTGGNKKRAADIMAIPRTTLAARMRKLGLERDARD
jgi:DNA-binding NtrC family response regulator